MSAYEYMDAAFEEALPECRRLNKKDKHLGPCSCDYNTCHRQALKDAYGRGFQKGKDAGKAESYKIVQELNERIQRDAIELERLRG